MADEEMITHEGVQRHPTVVASVSETSEKQEGNTGACTSAVASVTDAAVAEFDVRKPPPSASSVAYLRRPTPPCSTDSMKSNKDSRKTSIRYNSGNSRKSSNNNMSGSRGTSGIHAETCSTIQIHRRGSSSNSRNCTGRASSSNGTVNGTVTARKCVGCAAGGDNAPVTSGTPRLKTSGSDTQSVACVCEVGVTPRLIGTISYACSSAAQSPADERAQPTLREVQQQQQYKQEEGGQQGAQCQQQQRHQQQHQQRPPHLRQEEPQEVQRHQHTPEGQQQRQHQLPLLVPLQNPQHPQPHSKHQPAQQDSTQLLGPLLTVRRDFFQSSALSAEAEQEKPLVSASERRLQHTREHVREEPETQRHPQQQLQRTQPTEQGLEPPQQILHQQHLPVQQAYQPQQQQLQQCMHPQQQILQVMQSEKQTRKLLQSQMHEFSFAEYVTREFDPVSTTGTKCESAQVLHAARELSSATAGQKSGSVISCVETEECRGRAVPRINAEKVSGPACSSQTRVTQQQHESKHQVSSAAPQCRTPSVRHPVGLNAAPSPSVANAGATPLSRLAAASKRHQPPPCTAFPSTLPRCHLSSSGAYPEMTPIPMLNGDFNATTTYAGKTALSPTAAAVLREAASAAAAAAAAATDAATLVKNTIPLSVSAGCTGNAAPGTTATGAPALAIAATSAAGSAPSTSAPPADANTTKPLEVQQRETANHSAFETAESRGTAVSHPTQEQQQQHQQRQTCQQGEHCDSRLNHAAGTECCTQTAESPSMLFNAGCLVRDHCCSRVSCSSSNSSSETSGDRRHAEQLRTVPLTAPCESSGIQDVYAAVEAYVAVAGVDGVTLAASALARKAPDRLFAASSAVFKNATQGGSTPDVAAAVGNHALPRTTAPTFCVCKPTEAAAAAGGTDEEETAVPRGKATGAGQEAASVAAVSGATVTAVAQTYAADSSAATFATTAASAGTPLRATAAAGAAEETLQLRRAEIGGSTAAGGTRKSAASVKEAAVGGARPSLLATPGRQRHRKGFCGPLLQPLQLPESPRNSCTSAGGSPVTGTAGGEAALARDLSPTATPGTPQNRHQLQQLLLHRTPAPQDRPRRPAAAAAAGGVVVRRGGPVAMWGTGGTSMRATSPAAPDRSSKAAAEQAAANTPNAVLDATVIALVSSNTAGETASAAGDAAAAAESATVREAIGVQGQQQQDPGDASGNSSSSAETLHTEEGRQSGGAEGLEETMSTMEAATKVVAQTTALIPVTTSAAREEGQIDVKPPAGNLQDAAEQMATTEPEETYQQREHTVLQPQGIQTPQEESQGEGSAAKQQRLQQLEENEQRQSSTTEEQQTVRKDSSQVLRQEPRHSEAQQRPRHHSDEAQEQERLLEPGYQNGCELMRDGQQVLQRPRQAIREIIANEQELLSQRNNSEFLGEQIRFGTSTLPVSIPGSPERISSRPAVASRVAVAAGSGSCSWSTTDEDQLDVQMLDAHGYPGGELDCVSGGKNWSCSRRRTTTKKNKTSRTKTFRISTEDSQSGSSDLGEVSSTSWSGLCSTSSLRDGRNGDCTRGGGGETLYGSDADLIYFPFSQESGILGPPFVDAGAAEAAAETDGTAPVRSSAVSAIWQMQAASEVDGAASSSASLSYVTPVTPAVLLQPPFSGYGELQQQGEADSAAVTECEVLDAEKGDGLPQQPLPYVSADDRDVEDNLPVSAAAMAAADAAAHLKTPRSCVISATEDSVGHEEDLEYAPAAAEQATLPWAASAWDPNYKLNTVPHKAPGLRANQRGDTIFASQLQHAPEEVPLSQLQEQFQQQQQQPDLWQLQPQYEQRLHVKSCWNTATESVAGAASGASWQSDNTNCSTFDFRQRGAATPAGRVVAAPVASAASAVATAAPQGLSHLRSTCPSWLADIPAVQTASGGATQVHEPQIHHQLRPPASVSTNAAFVSHGSVVAKLCQHGGRQQHDFLAPEQGQFLKTGRHVSHPTVPLLTAAVAVHGEDGVPLAFGPPKPTTSAGSTPQHQQTQQLLQISTGLGICNLKQATAADAAQSRSTVATDVAAAGGASVTTGNPAYVNAVQRADIPMTTLQEHMPGPLTQQRIQHQQVPPQRLQHLYEQQEQPQQLHTPQQQQQQVMHLRQSLSPLSSSRIQSLGGAQVLEKPGQGDGSPAGVTARSCGAALVAPPPRQEQAFGGDGFLATAVAAGDHHSFPVDHVILNSRLKRAAPGAAAAALAAAASGAATGTGTCSARSAATATAASTALPARYQEEGEAFCPFRRTVEARRPCNSASANSSSLSAGGAEGKGDTIELAGEERQQSSVSNRSSIGLVRKRFLGGTTRLFGGVKMHAAAAARQGKVTPSKDAAPIALALSVPHQSSQSGSSGGFGRHTPAHTPRAGTPSTQHSPVALTRQKLLGGMQQQQPCLPIGGMQWQVAGVEQQLQQPLSPSSQHGSLSQQHIPRESQCHQLPELTQALSPVLVQQYVQVWPDEQQQPQHQFRGRSQWQGAKCARSPSLPPELLQRERVPSRRGYSYSSTFLCETIPGSNNYVTIAPVGRGSQRGSSRSRRKTPPRLPCVAGRLLLAGGRVVGEVGQAAVDVGSTMVKELANVLQRSLENIIDKGEDTSCDSSCKKYQPTCGSSLCMPLTCAKAGFGSRNSSHLLRQESLTRMADAAMGAVHSRHHLCCLTEEQLQHNLWLQHARPGELQQQQRTAVEVLQQPQAGEWQQPQGLVQQLDWRGSQSWPQPLEEHKQCELLEQRNLKAEAPVKAWGIATEERLGGLWLPKVDSQHTLASQPEIHSGVGLNADQQTTPLQQSECGAPQHQQLNWNGENLKQHNEEKRGDSGCQQLQHQLHSVNMSQEYAEFPDTASQHPGGDLSIKEDMLDTILSPHRQAQQPAQQHRSHHSQKADLLDGGGIPQKREHHAPSDGIPAFPISLRWSDCTPQTPESHTHVHPKQLLPTDACRIQKSLEQQEVRDRLVRRATSVASLQSSDRRTCPRILHPSSRPEQPCMHAFSCWNRDYEHAVQQTPFQQETSSSSTADTSSVAFRKQHHTGRGDAAPSCSASSAEISLGDSNNVNLFQTDKEQSATEVREARKGTSTFGRPELMREFAGDHSMLLCCSDDGSNCSTVHSCREEDCGRRGISVETLSPRLSDPQGRCRREALSSASTRDENRRGRVLLRHPQQQDEPLEQMNETPASEVRAGQQQQQEAEQSEVATHRKRPDSVLQIQTRPQQHSCLSLQVQGIPFVKQPLTRPSTRFPLRPGEAVQTKQEGFFSMPCGAAMQQSDGMHAKLEACDRIVQRWKERATKTIAGNLCTGA